MDLISRIQSQAIGKGARIVLPEGTEERTLKAANAVIEANIANIILLGDPDKISQKAKLLGLSHIQKSTIINPLKHSLKIELAESLTSLRKSKGLELNQALKLIEDPLYLGVMLIKNGYADGEVAGADNATGDVLRPAFQIIKTAPGFTAVSGAFIMIFDEKQFGEEGIMIFADCAVNPEPSVMELAETAIASAATAKNIAGIEPRVAMLSFSTKGSARHPRADKVIEATALARQLRPDLLIDGELQADAAIVETIGRKKAPGSKVAGKANVLVFPSLETGNIAYKLVQRLAGAEAIGPILQGMAAPINDLSRGCSVDDIINLIAITSNQVLGLKKEHIEHKETIHL
jgi:phosphate acetyltransferase